MKSLSGIIPLESNKETQLNRERERMEWLAGKLPVPEVLYYGTNESNEYLLTTEIKGINASSKIHSAAHLPRLMQLLGEGLKTIHTVPVDRCPFDQSLDVKLDEARKRVEQGLVDEEDFDEVRQGMKAVTLFGELIANRPAAEDLVFTHGDYCLPNIIINERRISGFIDWGRAGISDRYQDLALAARSIIYNFGKDYVPEFFAAYGMDRPDESKMYFYQLLDEFF